MFKEFGSGFDLFALFIGFEGEFFHVGANTAFNSPPTFGSGLAEEF